MLKAGDRHRLDYLCGRTLDLDLSVTSLLPASSGVLLLLSPPRMRARSSGDNPCSLNHVLPQAATNSSESVVNVFLPGERLVYLKTATLAVVYLALHVFVCWCGASRAASESMCCSILSQLGLPGVTFRTHSMRLGTHHHVPNPFRECHLTPDKKCCGLGSRFCETVAVRWRRMSPFSGATAVDQPRSGEVRQRLCDVNGGYRVPSHDAIRPCSTKGSFSNR